MYTLHEPLTAIKGIGPATAEKLADHGLHTVKDFLLFLPLRYEDRSHLLTINELLTQNSNSPATDNLQLVTIKATVKTISNQFKGRFKSIQRATIIDETGKLNAIWFNNRFVMDSLKKGSEYYFSGKLNERGFLMQAKTEPVREETLHTNRLVPIYSSTLGVKDGTLRRILNTIIKELSSKNEGYEEKILNSKFLLLNSCFKQLHFPDTEEMVIKARERLALEELLGIIRHSENLKQEWQREQGRAMTQYNNETIITSLPFQLTNGQQQAVNEILVDLQSGQVMNRLLIGDVGSGKTVVAGLAAHQVLANGHQVALIAPTQMLAEQHAVTFSKLFPKMKVEVVTAKTQGAKAHRRRGTETELATDNQQPTLFIGTHALINRLDEIQPALIVYDEQHRFGVSQRSTVQSVNDQRLTPHVLTMSATPIPRSLMLTLFSHLHVSYLTELPPGRLPIKTWLVPESKRKGALDWITQKLQESRFKIHESSFGALALIVCPFIDPSASEALENVSAATETYEKIKSEFRKSKIELRTSLLHGRLTRKEKETVIRELYSNQVDVLVTTPIVEVGVDLPTADIIVIEAAERFGLASLHQLRGRVGRAGQQAYCLLFTTKPSQQEKERLHIFTEETNGIKLAEYDLKNRGAGNIFGTQQHGFDTLKYADWANLQLITQARQIYDQLKTDPTWVPFLEAAVNENQLPAAN